MSSRSRFTVDDARQLPPMCGPQVIQQVFGIGRSRFHVLDKQGAFDFLKVHPTVGPKRFSGILIVKYLQGDPMYVPTFGRKQKRVS